ncbi:hypothetical protein THAOC_01885, partial [Thalassiosira oceanica]
MVLDMTSSINAEERSVGTTSPGFAPWFNEALFSSPFSDVMSPLRYNQVSDYASIGVPTASGEHPELLGEWAAQNAAFLSERRVGGVSQSQARPVRDQPRRRGVAARCRPVPRVPQ